MNKSTGGGVGLMGLLFITFLVLKLTKVIGWSWWWIASPLWIPIVLSIIVIVYSICVYNRKLKAKKR